MNMNRSIVNVISLGLLGVTALSCATGARAVSSEPASVRPMGPKKRIGIAGFTASAGNDAAPPGLAALAQDMITVALQNSHAFVLVEREALAQVLKEHSLGQLGVLNERTAAQAGRILGLQAVLMGQVNVDPSTSEIGAGFFRSSTEARHARVSLRMIDTNTGELWYAESAEGHASAGSFMIGGHGGGQRSDVTLTRQAITQAAHALVGKVAAEAASKPWYGKVMLVRRGQIYISAGSEVGMPAGSTLEVHRLGERIGDIGRARGPRVGTMRLVEHQGDKLSLCEPLEGRGFRRGDIVEFVTPQVTRLAQASHL